MHKTTGNVRSKLKQHRTLLQIFLFCLVFFNSQSFTITNVATKYKASIENTPKEILEQWEKQDVELHAYVQSKVPAVLDHTGSATFDEHLIGVQSVLRFWKAPAHLASAGLFHSIYGSEGFQGFCLPLSERETLRKIIGTKAEFLVWIFCMVDRYTVDEHVIDWEKSGGEKINSNQTFVFRSRPELGRFEIKLNKDEFLDFIELTLADWLEQVEGAAQKNNPYFLWKIGEAYAYRRDQYAVMSKMLAQERAPRLTKIVPNMHRDVMATETESTIDLIQPRTPPVSKAAEVALEALRSAGENIPVNLAPQKRSKLTYTPEVAEKTLCQTSQCND